MRRTDFQFDLPEELIAQYPCPERDASRMLCVSAGGENNNFAVLRDGYFNELPNFLNEGDLLVLNNTKVIPARLYGFKETGGKVEIVVERIVSNQTFIAQMRVNKSAAIGTLIIIDDKYKVEVTGRDGQFFILNVFHNKDEQHNIDVMTLLSTSGHIPLPPYISRSDTETDLQRYQTVYADVAGAVAAPTAGLHFTTELLSVLADKGVDSTYVTLHVGAGTYQPVRADKLEDHEMHLEWLEVTQANCTKVSETKKNGGRVIAVGTTSVRCLETAALSGELKPFNGDTNIFIYPGYHFNVVDALITNFHLSESTLLMLVSAFAGIDNIKQAYQHAIKEKYRFFSYGDAMFIDTYINQ
ncbi:MAG: tRNA preQ1(34) S-adenosylmethionine ribosyltransferase-isomerase QueA [Gammaproteobacteria bacterium]